MNSWTTATYPNLHLATISIVSPDRMLMTVAASERRSYLSFVAVLRWPATITCNRKLPLLGFRSAYYCPSVGVGMVELDWSTGLLDWTTGLAWTIHANMSSHLPTSSILHRSWLVTLGWCMQTTFAGSFFSPV